MKNKFQKIRKDFRKEVSGHKVIYVLLAIALLTGLFVRTYRTDQILGFYYDQGRDALKVWDFWHKGDLMLIGPTTGIAGILRGPFYFYLIAPFYLLGGGNPVVPAYFLAFISMIAILLAYYLGYKAHSRAAGLLVVIISSFSFYMMVAARWLSNPTPMLLLSMILVWMMFVVAEEKNKKSARSGWAWVVIGLVSGMSLWHFGSSGEFFYFGALGVFFLWQLGIFDKLKRKKWKANLPPTKYVVLALGAFAFTMSPLILFDFLNNHLLSQNIKKFLLEEESFRGDFYTVFRERLSYFYQTFVSKIFNSVDQVEKIFLAIITICFVGFLPRFWKNDRIKILFLLLLSPIIGMLFFQGNEGNIYDYYMSGYYMIFLLILAVTLGEIWKYKIGKLFVLLFILLFANNNLPIVKARIISGVDEKPTIAFGNQMQAVEWILEDADGREFNTDIYVPPITPYSYDYLFIWLSQSKYGNSPIAQPVDLLYTLYEVDQVNPSLLQNWLVRQMSMGSIDETKEFGGITVNRRKRLIYE